jgi:hypothetical protein
LPAILARWPSYSGQSHEKFTEDYRSCSLGQGKRVANNSFPDGTNHFFRTEENHVPAFW